MDDLTSTKHRNTTKLYDIDMYEIRHNQIMQEFRDILDLRPAEKNDCDTYSEKNEDLSPSAPAEEVDNNPPTYEELYAINNYSENIKNKSKKCCIM